MGQKEFDQQISNMQSRKGSIVQNRYGGSGTQSIN